MAHHNRTPASILSPGERSFEVIHVNGHPNREQRRHMTPFRFRDGQRVNFTMFVPKRFQRPARNTSYVKPVATDKAA